MNKILCQYAIVRFAPYVETGEFANVGIILIAPKRRFFNSKLKTQRHGRITRFFDELDQKVYRATLKNIREELKRAQGVLNKHGFDKRFKLSDSEFTNQFFKEIVRTRETIIRFSEVRVVLVEDPATTLNELFSFYVERNFVTKKYREAVLESDMRKWFLEEKIAERFSKATIGDEIYHASFPFVEQQGDKPVKIIKPLHLAHDKLNNIIDHGGKWIYKINQLKKKKLLPDKVMFAVEKPQDKGKRRDAYHDIHNELTETGIDIVDYNNKDDILKFAKVA